MESHTLAVLKSPRPLSGRQRCPFLGEGGCGWWKEVISSLERVHIPDSRGALVHALFVRTRYVKMTLTLLPGQCHDLHLQTMLQLVVWKSGASCCLLSIGTPINVTLQVPQAMSVNTSLPAQKCSIQVNCIQYEVL